MYGGGYGQYGGGMGGGYGQYGGGMGGGYGQYGGGMGMGGGMGEMRSDMWINQNVPGGINSGFGERLDNYMGGNPNPSYGQIYGGAPGVGGGYGGGYGYQY